MTPTDSPLNRPIGLRNLIRGLIAVAAIVAVGSAFAEGHYGMAVTVVLFLAVAVAARIWIGRVR